MKEWGSSLGVLPPLGDHAEGSTQPYGAGGSIHVSRSEGDVVAAARSYLANDMSGNAGALAAADERVKRSAHLLEKEARRAVQAGKERHQMAKRLTAANRAQSELEAEKDALKAAVDWGSAAARTKTEKALEQKVLLLDKAERERDRALTKLRAVENRAVLASKRAQQHEEEKQKCQVLLDELQSENGFTREDYDRLALELRKKTEDLERLERMHEAMMRDAAAGFQEQMDREKAAVEVKIAELAKEREELLEQRARDASDKKEKERLQVEVGELQSKLTSMSLRTEKAEALLTEHEALKARCEHLEHVATNAKKQSELLTVENLEVRAACDKARGDLTLVRLERDDKIKEFKALEQEFVEHKLAERKARKVVEQQHESEVRKQQALFMSRVKKMEVANMEKLQRHIDEAKHLHDALNIMRGDLRRCEAAETDWKLKATSRAATIEQLEQHKGRQEEKLRSMEAARRRLDEAKREVEAVAAQVNPLKERVAGLITERDHRDELIVRLKNDAKIQQQKLKEEQRHTAEWQDKVANLVDRIHDQDAQLLTLQQALVDKYEDIREQVFSAEQMQRYHKFETERLKKTLEAQGARPIDIGVQTVMPGDDAATQVNFPKLERLKKFAPDDTVVDATQQYDEAGGLLADSTGGSDAEANTQTGAISTQTGPDMALVSASTSPQAGDASRSPGPVESGAPKQLWNDT
eukprot:COSAG02_NODE_357_length_23913_cov_6.793483_5_plen_700_part_00